MLNFVVFFQINVQLEQIVVSGYVWHIGFLFECVRSSIVILVVVSQLPGFVRLNTLRHCHRILYVVNHHWHGALCAEWRVRRVVQLRQTTMN